MTATLDRTTTVPAFTINRDDLAHAAATVARALPSRPPAPILAGARLSVDGDTLTVAGFDYETSTEITIPCDGQRDGTVIVSGNLLANIAKALPSKPVHVDVGETVATVKCGTSRFTLPTMPTDDYPALPDMPNISGTVDAGVFADAIDSVKTAVGNDDALPMLTGVHVTFEHGRITLTATDRFRLAVRTIEWECHGEPPAPILIPGKSLTEAARGMDAGNVTLSVGDGVLGIRHDHTASTMRLLDAEFPAFQKLLPEHHARVADVPVQELVQAVKRASLVAERGSRVELAFTEDQLTVSSGDDGSASSETLDITLAGEPVTIGFNPGYLLAGLATIDTERVLVGMSEASRPAVFAPNHAGMPDGNHGQHSPVYADHVHLLMPVRMPG